MNLMLIPYLISWKPVHLPYNIVKGENIV